MSKLNAVIYFWIFLVLVLVGLKLAGLDQNYQATFLAIGIATVVYIVVALAYSKILKAAANVPPPKKENNRRNKKK